MFRGFTCSLAVHFDDLILSFELFKPHFIIQYKTTTQVLLSTSRETLENLTLQPHKIVCA